MKKLLFYFLVLVPAAGFAQSTLTLSSAIDSALENNFAIRIARNEAEIDRINNTFGNAGGLPSLNATASNTNSMYDLNQKLSSGTNITKNGVTSHSINSGLTASMLLFNGLKILSTKERLSVLQQQGEVQMNLQVQNTIAAVMISYYDILRQQAYLDIIQSTIDLSREKSRIISDRYAIGMANEADILQSHMDLNLSEQSLATQQIIVEQGKIGLQELMGVKDFFPVIIKDTILVDKDIQRDSIFNFLENNPQFLSADQQVRINEQIVKELRAQRYPSIRLSTGYTFTYNSSTAGFNLFTQNYGPNIAATLQVPIFNGTIYKTQQDVAKVNVMNASLQKESLLNSLKAEAAKTFQSYENTLKQIQAQQSNFEDAEKLVKLILQKFQLNQATILDVKAAQASYETAGYLLINLQYAAKVAEIDLKRLVYRLAN